jgi:alkanesulfonate monooxygenase SsuD/methylene tetrahydromethanopterin reductase-like flavin-dependent oxidoreductase (luciferase family)
LKFGLFNHIQVPKPVDGEDWDPEFERRRWSELLEQSEFADSLGFDYIFFGEHHFSPEYSHNSSPEVILAALARTTKQARLCTGIVQISHNDPIRTAERFAAIDLISGGRVELGVSAGASLQEIEPFLRGDLDRRWDITDAATKVLADIWGSDGVYSGVSNEFFDYPPVVVVPKPFQRPHPPMWLAGNSAESVVHAATLGMGLFSHSAAENDIIAERVELYWKTLLESSEPIVKAVNPALSVVFPGLVARTDQEAYKRGRLGLEYFDYALRNGHSHAGEDYNLTRAFYETQAQRPADNGQVEGPPSILGGNAGLVIGGVESVKERLRGIEETNLDVVTFIQSFGLSEHEHIMESYELLAREVFPEFRERHAEHEAWRNERLARFRHLVQSAI